MYGTARALGIEVLPALTTAELTDAFHFGRVALVYLDSDEDTGHFSPLIAVQNSRAILPNTDRGSMPIGEFETKWSALGICRQCILISG
jgi:hypothetical protein